MARIPEQEIERLKTECRRRLNIDHLCRSNIDQGWDGVR